MLRYAQTSRWQDHADPALLTQGVVLVEFYVPWGAPSEAQRAIVERVAQRLENKAAVCRVNVEGDRDTAARYHVVSVPTLTVMRDGEEFARFVGLQSEETLENALKALL